MRVIDVMHLGRPRVIGCWQVGEVLIDPGPGSSLPTLLKALAGDRPRALLLTHIHLDHAGASGSLVKRWPELEVYVHERGAEHMVDPSRLLKSARRLYGEDMDRLWGEMLPVPEENIRVLEGGERVIDDQFEVAYTPGHASHHVCYLHRGTAFVGDVGGVRIEPSGFTIPPTPPPDIDLAQWHESISRVGAWEAQRIAVTHFGAYEDVKEQLAAMQRRLDQWGERGREQDLEAFVAATRSEVEANADPDTAAAYFQAAPPEQLYAGLERYWRKQAEAGAGADGTPVDSAPPGGPTPVS